MNTYKRQSRTPKPQPIADILARFEREAERAGYIVNVDFSNGRYAPLVNLQVWLKREEEVGKP